MIFILVIASLSLWMTPLWGQEVSWKPGGTVEEWIGIEDRDNNQVEDYFNPGIFPDSAKRVDLAIDFGESYDPVQDSAAVDRALILGAMGGHISTVQREVQVIWVHDVEVDGAIVDTSTAEVLHPTFRAILDSTDALNIGAQKLYNMALDTSTVAVRAKTSFSKGIDGVWYWNGSGFVKGYTRSTGKGVTIAILDSGVDNRLFANGSGQVGYVDIASGIGGIDPEDRIEGWHGTRIAVISTGLLPSRNLIGIAPEAAIVDVNVAMDSTGYTTMENMMRGMEWCITHMNTSWDGQDSSYDGIDIAVTGYVDQGYCASGYGHTFQSGDNYGSACDPNYVPPGNSSINLLANSMVQRGIVFVAAAGNCGCYNAYHGGMGLLANAEGVITVSAVDDNNTVEVDDDSIAPYSSYGNLTPGSPPKPDIAAPGTNIMQDTWHGCMSPGDIASGTSFAAPHVAGAAALLLEVAPEIGPDSVKTLLINNAVDKGDPGWDPYYGWGMLDARASVDPLFGTQVGDMETCKQGLQTAVGAR